MPTERLKCLLQMRRVEEQQPVVLKRSLLEWGSARHRRRHDQQEREHH